MAPRFPQKEELASPLLIKAAKTNYIYAPRKNLTHESAGGRVQSTSGQYSILSSPVLNGDTGDRHIIQDRGFQLSRTLRFRGAHCAAVGGRRFAEAICVRVRWRKHLPDGHS